MIERLLSVDFTELAGVVREVIADPSSNLPAAYLILGVVTLLVLIVFLVVLMVVAKSDDDDAQPVALEEPVHYPGYSPAAPTTPPSPSRDPWAALFWAAALLLILVAAGYTTSLPSVCTSCHTEKPHGAITKGDAHKGQQCVSCHESRGYVADVTLGMPSRVAHIVSSVTSSGPDAYGRVSHRACIGCHERTARRTSVVKSLGVRVSHAEPLAAGAECTDCHKLTAGRVGPVPGGMDTCIRCHNDAVTSSRCSLCHVADISVAVNREDRAPSGATALIETPDCGGCHSQKKCDSCHGMRMPHTKQFIESTHARAYAENLWFGDGRMCGRCHTATRRPCSKCHTRMPAHGPALRESHKGADPTGSGCVGCHNQPYVRTRNFCTDLCHRPGQGKTSR